MVNVLCSGPGPHTPASGVLGTSDVPVTGMLCPATPCQAANVAAAGTQAVATANTATIQGNIQTHIGQLETWLTANPNGAVLTAAQTKFVAQTLIGVGRLLLGLTSTVGGAT